MDEQRLRLLNLDNLAAIAAAFSSRKINMLARCLRSVNTKNTNERNQ